MPQATITVARRLVLKWVCMVLKYVKLFKIYLTRLQMSFLQNEPS